MRAPSTLLTPAVRPSVLMLLLLLHGLIWWPAAPALAGPRRLCVGRDLEVGPRERGSVLLALQRSSTFRREFLVARNSSRLQAAIRADVITHKAHFEHSRPRRLEHGEGFCVEGTARINVPSSPVEFGAQLGHELSHANSLQAEGCLADPECKPPSHEVRARAVENAIRREWRRRSDWIGLGAARDLLDGPAITSPSFRRVRFQTISR